MVVPRSKWYIVAVPRGLTEPLSVAVVVAMSGTAPVTPVGGAGGGGVVPGGGDVAALPCGGRGALAAPGPAGTPGRGPDSAGDTRVRPSPGRLHFHSWQ